MTDLPEMIPLTELAKRWGIDDWRQLLGFWRRQKNAPPLHRVGRSVYLVSVEDARAYLSDVRESSAYEVAAMASAVRRAATLPSLPPQPAILPVESQGTAVSS